jgi:hypothetical protein
MSPNDAAALDAGVTRVLHFIDELLVGRYVGHLDALAHRRILPGVIRAAQAVFLHPSEVERRQAVGAVGADESDFAGLRAKKNQVLAE